jgi:hypothetical protein
MAKKTVDVSLALDVLVFAREGELRPRAHGTHRWSYPDGAPRRVGWRVTKDALILTYELPEPGTGLRTHCSYPVPLVRTKAGFGGERVWFSCPACEKPVRKLYLPPGEERFLCRECHGLSYASRQRRVPAWEKALRRVEALERKLADPTLGSRRRLALNKASRAALDTLQETDVLADLRQPLRALVAKEPPPPVVVAAMRRGRGRPKEKRPYVRRRPFTASERHSPEEALCLRCRAFRVMIDPQPVVLPNARPARKGICPVCGATMCEITPYKADRTSAADQKSEDR